VRSTPGDTGAARLAACFGSIGAEVLERLPIEPLVGEAVPDARVRRGLIYFGNLPRVTVARQEVSIMPGGVNAMRGGVAMRSLGDGQHHSSGCNTVTAEHGQPSC
jgi:hypothetical protein